jgi:Tol biopolymer transport system component
MFYFVYRDKMYLFNTHGELEHKELLSSSSFNGSNDSSFLLGFFSLPTEITYLEYVNEGSNMTDLYQYDISTKTVTNLTEKVIDIISYKISPDQKSVALLTKDYVKNILEYSIMNLSDQSIKQIKTFPVLFDQGGGSIFSTHETYLSMNSFDIFSFYSFFWSPDSKYLFFTTSKYPEKEEDRDKVDLYFLYRVEKDGTDLKLLSDPTNRAFQASLSPNGKKIIYVTDGYQKVAVMNMDGSSKMVQVQNTPVNEQYDTFYFPRWFPKSNGFAYYRKHAVSTDSAQDELSLIFSSEKGKQLKNVNLSLIDEENLIPYLDTSNLFSPNNQSVSFIKSFNFSNNTFQAVLLKDLKEEIPLKGNNVDFCWSPSANQLLLIESKAKDQINQLTLYDCSTNSYIPISQDVQQIFDACWSPDGKQILYTGTDSKTGQIVFKTSQVDGSNQKLLFTFGENPLERPSSIEKIEKLVWLK